MQIQYFDNIDSFVRHFIYWQIPSNIFNTFVAGIYYIIFPFLLLLHCISNIPDITISSDLSGQLLFTILLPNPDLFVQEQPSTKDREKVSP